MDFGFLKKRKTVTWSRKTHVLNPTTGRWVQKKLTKGKQLLRNKCVRKRKLANKRTYRCNKSTTANARLRNTMLYRQMYSRFGLRKLVECKNGKVRVTERARCTVPLDAPKKKAAPKRKAAPKKKAAPKGVVYSGVCRPGQYMNPRTGVCVAERIGACKEGLVFNSRTGKCVKASGKIGKALLAAGAPAIVPVVEDGVAAVKVVVPATNAEKPKFSGACKEGLVFNPRTGKCVKASGKIGKALLAAGAPAVVPVVKDGVAAVKVVPARKMLKVIKGLSAMSPEERAMYVPFAGADESRKRRRNLTKQRKGCGLDELRNPKTGNCVKRGGRTLINLGAATMPTNLRVGGGRNEPVALEGLFDDISPKSTKTMKDLYKYIGHLDNVKACDVNAILKSCSGYGDLRGQCTTMAKGRCAKRAERAAAKMIPLNDTLVRTMMGTRMR